ncbi:MAG: hypothetical protein ATN33_00090 [Epulopiscium sp. Nele67-Bin001]|nr:MAG: hypothetical protein ATN33_00090 [Epulopiscium sp. Nele67-Bin001]
MFVMSLIPVKTSNLVAHVWGGDQVEECFLLTLGPSDIEEALIFRLQDLFLFSGISACCP